MNAHKFVAEHGIDKAKRVLEGAPSKAQRYFLGKYFKQGEWTWWWSSYLNKWLQFEKHIYGDSKFEIAVDLSELKQVVDSIDYLNEWYEGKIDGAYDHVERMHGMLKLKPQFPNLHSRIKLVERHLANYELVKANKNGEA
ncbi:hypothetical protein [uncultured Acinetobacter sp.]|uniref:hypothetical protein n=1 Tax=uncultured Acinetobacter sp. TaxID=165433 RepID=UPI00258370D1|nr:hypothetical protein [uncultured Acinetobacter sp.]